MISSRDLYKEKYSGFELEKSLMTHSNDDVIARNLNFINLGKFEIENLSAALISPLIGESKFNKQVENNYDSSNHDSYTLTFIQ